MGKLSAGARKHASPARRKALARAPLGPADTLGDEWADELPPRAGAVCAPPTATTIITTGAPSRKLGAKVSGERSPKGAAARAAADAASPCVPAAEAPVGIFDDCSATKHENILKAERYAGLGPLQKRPELSGKLVWLRELEETTRRWACELRSGHAISVSEDSLRPILDAFQGTAKTCFETEA